jgi:hypothetical protein
MRPALKDALHCVVDNALRRHALVLHRGAAGSMLVAGEERWSRYLPARFFRGDPVEKLQLGSCRAAELPAALDRWQELADITVARVDRLSQRLFPAAAWLRVPEWIRMVARVPAPPEGFANSSARSDQRRVRKNGLTWRISHDPAELATHLRRDYYRYTRLRHGDDAFVQSPRLMRRSFCRGGLLWVEQAGRPLAGLVFEHSPPLLRMVTMACVDADARHLLQGALVALYLFSFDYARSRGLTAIDMRGSRPCLRDELFSVKRKFGGRIEEKPDNTYDLLVRWRTTTPPVLHFLGHSPLIVRERGRLSALCVAGDSPPVVVPELLRRLEVTPDAAFGQWDEPAHDRGGEA